MLVKFMPSNYFLKQINQEEDNLTFTLTDIAIEDNILFLLELNWGLNIFRIIE